MLKNIFRAMPIAIIVAGCSLFMPVNSPQIHTYELSVIKHSPSTLGGCENINTSGEVLQVPHVKADAPYDNLNMYYSNYNYELDSYATHQWVALPSDMLTQAMQQRLLQSCVFANVVNAGFMTMAKYRLTTQLVNFKQTINGSDTLFDMTVILQLVDNKTNQVVKGRTFNITIPTTPDPKGYIDGANKATDEFLVQLLAWVK